MAVNRQLFAVNTDTGSQVFTGVPFEGGVMQVGWNAQTGDTGADLLILLLPKASNDTGDGWIIYNDNDSLGADFLKSLVNRSVHANGSDTVASGAQAAYASASDHLYVRVTPGGAAVVGDLYVWTYTG